MIAMTIEVMIREYMLDTYLVRVTYQYNVTLDVAIHVFITDGARVESRRSSISIIHVSIFLFFLYFSMPLFFPHCVQRWYDKHLAASYCCLWVSRFKLSFYQCFCIPVKAFPHFLNLVPSYFRLQNVSKRSYAWVGGSTFTKGYFWDVVGFQVGRYIENLSLYVSMSSRGKTNNSRTQPSSSLSSSRTSFSSD